MDTDRSLSEIARSVLSQRTDGDPKSFREKAGLLALLNLLGIVEAFYGEMPGPEEVVAPAPAGLAVSDPVVETLVKAPASGGTEPSGPAPAPVSPPSPMQPISIVSTLAKLIGSAQAGAQANAPADAEGGAAPAPSSGSPLANLLAGIDPSMIASMLGMVAAMAKPRPAKPPTKVEAQVSDETPASGESGTSQAESAPGPEAAPPSPLQQFLGIDPKVLTLILNVIAEFMKNRPAEAKEKPTEARPASESSAKGATAVEAKPPVQAAGRRSPLRAHRPGLGIYRAPSPPPKPQPQQQE